MLYDMVLRDGFIVDGTGGPWFRGDVAIKGERIADIGRLDSADADKVIDAGGLVVSPGFIDIHSHSELSILINPPADSLVRQGVTTIINGNCGFSPAPISEAHRDLGMKRGVVLDWSTFGEYFDRLEKQGSSINSGSYVGLAELRIAAMGGEAWDRLPTGDEMEEMKGLAVEAMEDGVFGLSTGLEYPPQTTITTQEIIEICREVAGYGGIYSTHIRSRDVKVVDATREAIKIGDEARIAVQVAHFGARFPSEGKTKLIVDLAEEARKRGVDIAFDQIPWTIDENGIGWCGCSMISPIVSGSKFTDKGGEFTFEMLKDPQVIQFLKEDLYNRQYGPILAGERGLLDTWDRVLLIHCEKNPQYNGKNMREIGEMMGRDPFNALIEILVAEGEDYRKVWGAVGITSLWDTNFSLLHPHCSVTADSSNDAPYGPLAQQPITETTTRAYGQFPYFFEKWVREDRALTLEEAVRKCTGLPAQRTRLTNRGLLRPGMHADIVVFDIWTIGNRSTWDDPRRYPEGIHKVLVNGRLVIDEKQHTGALTGEVLRLNDP